MMRFYFKSLLSFILICLLSISIGFTGCSLPNEKIKSESEFKSTGRQSEVKSDKEQSVNMADKVNINKDLLLLVYGKTNELINEDFKKIDDIQTIWENAVESGADYKGLISEKINDILTEPNNYNNEKDLIYKLDQAKNKISENADLIEIQSSILNRETDVASDLQPLYDLVCEMISIQEQAYLYINFSKIYETNSYKSFVQKVSVLKQRYGKALDKFNALQVGNK